MGSDTSSSSRESAPLDVKDSSSGVFFAARFLGVGILLTGVSVSVSEACTLRFRLVDLFLAGVDALFFFGVGASVFFGRPLRLTGEGSSSSLRGMRVVVVLGFLVLGVGEATLSSSES